MKTLSIKNVPADIHQRLRRQAKANHRSLNGELLAILEHATDPLVDVASGSISDFLLNSPLRGSGLELDRDGDNGRDVDL